MGLLDYFFPPEEHEDIPGDLLGAGLWANSPLPAQPLIIVHPYFPFEPDVGPLVLRRGECVRRGYVDALESLIISHEGPIITLEEDGRCMRTLQRYEDIGRVSACYVIPTVAVDPLPLQGWPILYRFLEHFTIGPVLLAGGQHNPPRKHPHDTIGCLNIAASVLAKRGITHAIRTEATFSRCLTRGRDCRDIAYPGAIPSKSFSSSDASW